MDLCPVCLMKYTRNVQYSEHSRSYIKKIYKKIIVGKDYSMFLWNRHTGSKFIGLNRNNNSCMHNGIYTRTKHGSTQLTVSEWTSYFYILHFIYHIGVPVKKVRVQLHLNIGSVFTNITLHWLRSLGRCMYKLICTDQPDPLAGEILYT